MASAMSYVAAPVEVTLNWPGKRPTAARAEPETVKLPKLSNSSAVNAENSHSLRQENQQRNAGTTGCITIDPPLSQTGPQLVTSMS